MRRRRYLATLAVLAGAGCSSSTDGDDTPDGEEPSAGTNDGPTSTLGGPNTCVIRNASASAPDIPIALASKPESRADGKAIKFWLNARVQTSFAENLENKIYQTPEAEQVFVVFAVKAENVGETELTLGNSPFKIEYRTPTGTDVAPTHIGRGLPSETLAPGETAEGWDYLEVPQESTSVRIAPRFPDSAAHELVCDADREIGHPEKGE